MKTNQILFLFLTIISFNFSGFTQNSANEIGVRTGGLDNLGFIYKKARSTNKYLRFRTAITDFSYLPSSGDFAANIGFSIGWERRIDINQSFQFLHGFEPSIRLTYNTSTNTQVFTPMVNLGYVLGFQYNFSSPFSIGLETIPSLNGSMTFASNNFGNSERIWLGFNSHAVAVKLLYRFNSTPKE